MKWLIGALAALFLCPAYADFLDELQQENKLCAQWVTFVEIGQKQQKAGARREFVYLNEMQVMEMIEHKQSFRTHLFFLLPKERDMTEREMRFWEQAAGFGYDNPELKGKRLVEACPVAV